MHTKHAVLFYPDRPFPNTAIMWIENNRLHCEELPDPCYTLRDLAEVAYSRFVTHLWVMPTYGDFEPHKAFPGWSFSVYENRQKKMMGAAARKDGHQRIDVNIIFPQYTSWYGTERAPGWLYGVEPHDLLIVLHYLEQALGIVVAGSPGRTGWNYLKKLHPEWIEEIPGVNLEECHFDKKAAADIIWQRALFAAERTGKKYLHKFDEGAAYPYAGTQTDIGAGTPVHVNHGRDAIHEKGHPQAVGVWFCDVERPESYNDLHYMPVPNVKPGFHWLMGPRIRMLEGIGFSVKPLEGWVFPERHDTLVKWGKDLWNIRQGFDCDSWKNRRCAHLAKVATKQIMNTAIGITAFRGFDDNDEMKRPDIRQQVIARHSELTWHRIEKIRSMYGAVPVLVYMDALYYISSNPDGRAALPELVRREGQFGGYRWEGRVELTHDVLQMFDLTLSEADRLEFLNKIGWTK